MLLPVTSLLAAALALLLFRLSLRAIKARRRAQVPVGVTQDEGLLRAVRAQGNFTEYMPLTLLLLALCELNGVTAWWLGPVALAILAGRVMHAHSLLTYETAHATAKGMGRFVWRVRGMTITLFALPILAATLIGALAIRSLG
ncbi:MAG: MAPEG family protein [Pseudomonadota bacterium]